MNQNLKLLLVVFATFLLAICTSFLLEIPLLQHWIRQTIIIIFIIVECYFGYVLFKFILNK